jgi:hypothetical protein
VVPFWINFWEQVRECHPKLKENGVSRLFCSGIYIIVKLTCPVDNLSRNPLAVPSDQSSMVIFQGLDRNRIDFTPVFDMAAEYFTHLGIARKCTIILYRDASHDTPVSSLKASTARARGTSFALQCAERIFAP